MGVRYARFEDIKYAAMIKVFLMGGFLMTKVITKKIKCANCGTESEQMIVYSINYSLGNQEDNARLREHKQVCPNCNYTAPNIDFKIKALNVVPYKSVGDLTFGMKREEVRNIMGGYKEVPKSQFADNSSDSFNRLINCYYDKNNNLNGVVISNEINVTLDGKTILPISEDEFNKMFDDAILNYDGESITWVKSVGITTYNYDGEVDTLTIGTRDFFGKKQNNIN